MIAVCCFIPRTVNGRHDERDVSPEVVIGVDEVAQLRPVATPAGLGLVRHAHGHQRRVRLAHHALPQHVEAVVHMREGACPSLLGLEQPVARGDVREANPVHAVRLVVGRDRPRHPAGAESDEAALGRDGGGPFVVVVQWVLVVWRLKGHRGRAEVAWNLAGLVGVV